jgi:hypothetical protein
MSRRITDPIVLSSTHRLTRKQKAQTVAARDLPSQLAPVVESDRAPISFPGQTDAKASNNVTPAAQAQSANVAVKRKAAEVANTPDLASEELPDDADESDVDDDAERGNNSDVAVEQDYEALRQANMARNQAFLESLGLGDAQRLLTPSRSRESAGVKRRRESITKAVATPVRSYSLRTRVTPTGTLDVQAAARADAQETPQPVREENVVYYDSKLVVRDDAVAADVDDDNAPIANVDTRAPLVGWSMIVSHTDRGTLSVSDASLDKVYGMDWGSHDGRLLLATAGHGGRAAVRDCATT